MRAQTYVRPTCRYCRRDWIEHCDECRACWQYGLDPADGERLLGCPLHDGLRMTARWRFTSWEPRP
jgi:hypothetical protein